MQERFERKGASNPFVESGYFADRNIEYASDRRAKRIVASFQARLTDIYGFLDGVIGAHADVNKIMDIRAALGRKHQLGQMRLAKCRAKLAEIEEKYRLLDEEKAQAEAEKIEASKPKTKKRKAKAME